MKKKIIIARFTMLITENASEKGVSNIELYYY